MIRKHPLVIFEGVELAGKSWLMSQVYDKLENKNNKSGKILDGCAWLNVDVGVLGSEKGYQYLSKKMELLDVFDDRPVLLEKFHLSDVVYSRLHRGKEVGHIYKDLENKLADLGAKLVLVDVRQEKDLFEKRLSERLAGVSHYQRIAKDIKWYLEAREEYEKEYEKSILSKIKIDNSDIPNNDNWQSLMRWMGE